ncbi:unnamed protein product [Mytilus coruscus]|uniref:Peptidase S1 domain-containing protein n=1 Tax=Mytilus coruscus TaxID=42192 RepID=A0A6J8EGC8_MYTCO|nr:unnamed protein product [Mytilus coruscus]
MLIVYRKLSSYMSKCKFNTLPCLRQNSSKLLTKGMGNCQGKISKESKSQMRGEAYRPSDQQTKQEKETHNVGDKLDKKIGSEEDAEVTNGKTPFVNPETSSRTDSVLQGTNTSVSDMNGLNMLKVNDNMEKQDQKQHEPEASFPEKPVEISNKDGLLIRADTENDKGKETKIESPTGILLDKVPGSQSDNAEKSNLFSKGVLGEEPQTEDSGFTNILTGIKDPASTDQISRSNEIVSTDNAIDEDKSLTKEVDNVPTEKASGSVSEPTVENRSNQSNELKSDSTEKPSDQFQPGNTPSDKLQPGNYPSDKLQPGNTPSDKLQPGNTPSYKLQPENAPSDNQQNNDDSTGYNRSKFSYPGDEQDEKMSKEMKEIDGKKGKKKKKKRDKYEPPPNANIQNYYGYVDVLNLGNDNVYMGKKEKEEEKDPIRPTTICSLETMQVLTEVAKSVGYITGCIESGTCWRVGNDKIITAAHVVLGNIYDTDDKTTYNEKLLKTFEVDFDYISEKSQRFFKVEPRVLFMDESLDVAVLQLKPDNQKQFPPPLQKFYKLNPKKDEDKHIYLISHNKGIKKEVNSGIGIWNPTEKRMEDLERFCQKYGQQNGYIELDRKDRIVIQCEFVGGASGSPGIVIFNNVAHVVFVYIRGFPSFYYSKQFTGEKKRKYPSEKLLQQGVNIGDLFDTMSKKAVNLTLRNEIFPVEAKLEQTINQHQLAITGDKISSNTNKTETPIDIVKGKMDNISSKSEMKGIVCTDQSEDKIPDAASYNRLMSHVSVPGQT